MNKPPNPDNARSTRGGKATRVSASPRLDTPEVDANPWALLNSLEYGVVFLSPDERVVCCNAAFLRIWKMPTESSIAGVSLDELLATAFTLHAFIDRTGKPVRPPVPFVTVMNRVFA